MVDYIKIGIGIILLIILFIGIKKSLKIKKLGYFLVALFIDILIVLGLYFGINFFKGDDENTMKETDNNISSSTTTSTTTTTKKIEEGKKTSKGFVIEEKDGVTYIDGYMIVNKTYTLPSDYVPSDTYAEAGTQKHCQTCIINEAWDKYNEMKSDSTALGLNIFIASGYRSYNFQESLYNNYVARDGKEAADTYSARAGHSEHQSGYAFDLNSVEDSFQYTSEGIWINENCYKYGFIIRYPKGKESETGYIYEPWHLRYVGSDLATKLYNNGDWITMEDYFGITSKYEN